MDVRDKAFFDCKLRLDDQRFIGCKFKNVTFEFDGSPFGLIDCIFLDSPKWDLGGPLGEGLQALVSFYRGAGAIEVLAEAIAHFLTTRTGSSDQTISIGKRGTAKHLQC